MKNIKELYEIIEEIYKNQIEIDDIFEVRPEDYKEEEEEV